MTPSRISSGTAPTLEATTGRPAASASRTTFGRFSLSDGRTRTCAEARNSADLRERHFAGEPHRETVSQPLQLGTQRSVADEGQSTGLPTREWRGEACQLL